MNSKNEKYSDNLSSAITFFICGIAGIIILILNALGIINLIEKESSMFIMINVVLGFIFVIFLIIGFWTLKTSKKLKSDANEQDILISKVNTYLDENVTKENIDNALSSEFEEDTPDEMKYFARSEYVKKAIKDEFPDIDDETLELINDSFLEKIY